MVIKKGIFKLVITFIMANVGQYFIFIIIADGNFCFAQHQPAPSEPPAAPKAQDQMLPQPPAPPGDQAAGAPDAMWPHDHAGRPHGEFGRHWGPPPPPPFPMPSKAAHFVIKDGSRRIDVKCADDEPTKVCADTVLQIIDKLGSAPEQSDDDE